jgi:hypothetical protein
MKRLDVIREAIMFYYETPIGMFQIVLDPFDRFVLKLNDIVLDTYSTPEAAALDVYAQSTGLPEWDLRYVSSMPVSLEEWEREPSTGSG